MVEGVEASSVVLVDCAFPSPPGLSGTEAAVFKHLSCCLGHSSMKAGFGFSSAYTAGINRLQSTPPFVVLCRQIISSKSPSEHPHLARNRADQMHFHKERLASPVLLVPCVTEPS